jgi:hypothetical protein
MEVPTLVSIGFSIWVLARFCFRISTQVSIGVPTEFYAEFSTWVLFLLIFYFDRILQLDKKHLRKKHEKS